MTTPKYFATRYDSARDEVIALLADESEGYGSGRTGNVDAPMGSIDLVHLDETCELDFANESAFPAGDEVGDLAREYGVTAADVLGSFIVTYNDQGCVSVEWFETRELANERFQCLEGAYDVWSAREDDDTERETGWETYVCPVIGHGYHEV